ncbi:MAG: hypothetical protein R6V50_04450 [Thermoplasmatota archaeon]
MKKSLTILCIFFLVGIFVFPTQAVLQKQPVTTASVSWENDTFFQVGEVDDFDPLVDTIIVTVEIEEIRMLEDLFLLTDPDLFIKVFINGDEFVSEIWENTKYVREPDWSASAEVPKDVEYVDIAIELWATNKRGSYYVCDISPRKDSSVEDRRAEMTYSIATGIWWGDDYLGDPSGYGRLNGCDDGTIYQNDKDAELLFSISQNDYDGDRIPYWLEVNVYNTCPLTDNTGEDADNDGVPIEWEHRFGLACHTQNNQEGYLLIYNPNVWENHNNLDPDNDGLTNIEEYKTSQWGSDPFRQDIFIQINQMELGPNGEGADVPELSFDMIRDSHARQNIRWHIDDGRLGGGGLIPFKENIEDGDLSSWYWTYFMKEDSNYWRRGVFRWCIIPYESTWAAGFAFSSRIGGKRALDCTLVSSKAMLERVDWFPLYNTFPIIGKNLRTFDRDLNKAYVFAGAIMHESGHTLNIRAPGVDIKDSIWPWQRNYWEYKPYKSCMNYQYMYRGVIDYSDGSRGGTDHDDWGNLDLRYFLPRSW